MAKEKVSVKEQIADVAVEEKQDISVIDDMMSYTPFNDDDDDAYQVAKTGMEMLLNELCSRDEQENEIKVDGKLIDQLIKEVDVKLSHQLDEILHHDDFKKAESTWRGLQFLINKVDFEENVKIELFCASKEELLADFEDSGGAIESNLYRKVYTEEYGQFGGEPFGMMLGAYEFSHKAQDVQLLEYMAQVSAMANAPFIASASPKFFTVNDYKDLTNIKDLPAIFDAPQYAKWNGFRDSDDARNVGLALPRFMLREPYGEENIVREVKYNETIIDNESYVWGYAGYALASCIATSFANYRWCPNIIGPNSGGSVTSIPMHVVGEGRTSKAIGPTEVAISDRREYELAESGFIPLVVRKGSNQATFFSAHSTQKIKTFGNTPEGKEAELNFRLGAQLPFWFIITRISHYLKVLQRESLGSWKNREDVEIELNKWLRQYIADQENPSAAIRSQRPLRGAHVKVEDMPGEAGWYRIHLDVTPHFKFMGANFTLSLSGMVEKS